VIVVSGRAKPAKLAHVAAAADVAPMLTDAASSTVDSTLAAAPMPLKLNLMAVLPVP
jgi:hypothetical protein